MAEGVATKIDVGSGEFDDLLPGKMPGYVGRSAVPFIPMANGFNDRKNHRREIEFL